MEVKKCFESSCPHEAEYLCNCIPPGTYSCELHVGKHLKLKEVHSFESIFVESCEDTKEEILKVLVKKIFKSSILREKVLAAFNQHFSKLESNLKELLKFLDKSSCELSKIFSKIMVTKRISKSEQDPILSILCLEPDKAAEKIKAMLTDYSYWLENAESELKILSGLRNPYVIFLDSFSENNASNLLENCDLLKYIADKKSENHDVDEDEIWKYSIQISFGLEALHTNGLIHGDIKPKNILLDKNMNVKLANFGLHRYTKSSFIEDTSPYHSPNMYNEEFPTKESDILGLGCILYYLCNLEDLYEENKQIIQNEQHIEIKSKYSQELRYFLGVCLKKERNERITINGIITNKFIVNKAISLGITIPTTSDMSKIYQGLLNSEREKNLKLERKLSEYNNDIISQKAEIKHLKSEIDGLKNVIEMNRNSIESLKLKDAETASSDEICKNTLNEKQLVETQNFYINRRKIVNIEKIDEILDYSEQDLNKKESEITQNVIDIATLENLRSELLNSSNNPELEKKYRRVCFQYENDSSFHDTPTSQAYQDYVKSYHQKTSLFNLVKKDKRTNLLIYNTETETREIKILETPEILDYWTCITQLPNGKLFCFGSYNKSGITLIIDEDYRVEMLPSGPSCSQPSAMYFNKNVYCFGGWNKNSLALSSRFDLGSNQWIELTPLPKTDYNCDSIVFNENILICGTSNPNLLRYLVDINSFITIPYVFGAGKRKNLISADRLYLIQWSDGLYESEIGSDAAWRLIANSKINDYYNQEYYLYNKGEIYIGCIDDSNLSYFKFNLKEKTLTQLV